MTEPSSSPDGAQASWLREATGRRVTVLLLGGATIVGDLLQSDESCLLVHPSREREPVLIYKSAVSTLTRASLA